MPFLQVLEDLPHARDTCRRRSRPFRPRRIDNNKITPQGLDQAEQFVDHHLIARSEMPQEVDQDDPVQVTIGMIADGNEWAFRQGVQPFGIADEVIHAHIPQDASCEVRPLKRGHAVIEIIDPANACQAHQCARKGIPTAPPKGGRELFQIFDGGNGHMLSAWADPSGRIPGRS